MGRHGLVGDCSRHISRALQGLTGLLTLPITHQLPVLLRQQHLHWAQKLCIILPPLSFVTLSNYQLSNSIPSSSSFYPTLLHTDWTTLVHKLRPPTWTNIINTILNTSVWWAAFSDYCLYEYGRAHFMTGTFWEMLCWVISLWYEHHRGTYTNLARHTPRPCGPAYRS